MPDLARAVWLQAMMTHRIVTEKQGRALHKAAAGAARVDYRASQYNNFVHEASTAISGLGLEVRRIVDEWTGKPLLAIVNTKGDEIAQLATTYSPNEIGVVKRLAEVIFTAQDETFSCTMMLALNVATRDKTSSMTKKAAEELVHNLVRHQWLRMSPSGRLFLTPRSLLELEPWLKEQFPEHVLECAKCHDIVTKGSACSRSNCSGRLHHFCERGMPGSHNGTAKCYVCKANWEPLPVGEESLGTGRRPRASQATQARDDDDDEGLDNEETEEDAEEAMTSTERRKRQRRSNGNTVAANGRRGSTSSFGVAAGRRRSSQSGPSGAAAKRRRSSRSNVVEDDEGDEGDEDENEDQDDEVDNSLPPARRSSSRRASTTRGQGRNFIDDDARDDDDDDEGEEEEGEDDDDD
ncbi:hypothetical protein BDZ90DRAFT_281212 [Jaminaea rosea]|uniref:Non-structural maintenance of chromosomes element 1 homolog n=1 Tax=Jaminaea rosea TaxID=1569628 RepID=A0A316UKR0_9BASI|nr:hypothetical protein BDZ90DRAFT_281212 [Jaminaea rosea]PWN25820.1 hypothetical protein BDZ90DRAFT_281212 [Jaminaea rosea]